MPPLPPVLDRYIEGLQAHDVQKISGTVLPEVAFITPTRRLDKEQFLAMLRALYTAFPDWRYDHDPPELRGETIAIRWRQGGTHTGTFVLAGLDPVPATGRRVRIPEQYFFYTVRSGAIAEIRPEPIPGGAPRGILEQIGHPMPPL
jgi:predicted ester cyclase